MNNVEILLNESTEIKSFAAGYLKYLSELLLRLDTQQISDFVENILLARERGSRIFFLGNGGSSATASHFANDIAIGSRSWTKPYRAVALTDNTSIVTAIANDYGYDEIFVLQLKIQAQPNDVVVAISASGNSPNVVKALEYANLHDMVSIALTGFDGGKLNEVCQFGVHVNTPKGEYGPVEDAHMVLDHLVGAYLMQADTTT